MFATTNFLTNDQLKAAAPTIFAPAAHASRSERYAYIPTSTVVDRMRSEGFAPVMVQAARVRADDRAGFQKHLIRFRRMDMKSTTLGEVLPEVVMINSHDGTSSYKLSAGLFRLVCLNGLMVADGQVEEVTVKHSGRQVLDDVVKGSFRVLEQSRIGIEAAGRWNTINLSEGEQTALAIGAHHARFADAEGNVNAPVEPAKLLEARRVDDRKSDLWTVFNRVQENVVKGGQRGETRDQYGRRRRVTTREVKGIDGSLTLNRALWKMAEHLAGLKTVAA